MDKQSNPTGKQNPNRPRQDSVTPEMRRHMQNGFPVRDDATQTINRPINRPAGPREVPPAMRQGKIPVRQDASRSRTYPVMNRNSQPVPPRRTNPPGNADMASGRPAADPSRITAVMDRIPPQTTQGAMHTTREVPRVPPAQPVKHTPRHAPLSLLKKVPAIRIGIAALVLVILVSVGLGAALSTGREAVPDFDMSAQYGEVSAETAGETDTAPETETVPPETTPPPVKFSVTLTFHDRDPITISTSETTLGALLEEVGYQIQDSDKFPLELGTVLTEDTTIAVDTVAYTTVTATESIPFESKVTNVRTIPRGQKNVIQKGQNGVKTITYEVKTVNGEEVSRTVVKEEITTAPVTETSQLGIGGTIGGHSYSYCRTVNATYYDIEGITYLGYNADESVVAVDMDYIPLGTKIYVANDQFDFGVRTAADTGSMIEGWEVDIWLSDSNPQKAAFAQIGYVTDMIIYYLD